MGISADHVRAGMGDFTHLRSPSKVAARMGQCFSTTIHTLMVEPKGATAAGSPSSLVQLMQPGVAPRLLVCSSAQAGDGGRKQRHTSY